MNGLATLLFLLIPGLLIAFQDRVKLIAWLSPAFWAYALGILLRLILPLHDEWSASNMEIFVALAIPILLFSADVRRWWRLAKRTGLAYLLYVLTVMVSVCGGIWLWQTTLSDAALRGAMAMGVYTGGTANMAAIHVALAGPAALFAELNLTDLILSGSFLLLILSFLPRLLAYILPAFPVGSDQEREAPLLQVRPETLIQKLRGIAGSLLGGIVVLGLSFGASFLLLGTANGTVIVVLLSVFGLLASLISQVRRWPMSYETGDFLFLAFCIAAGAQIDLIALLDHDWSSVGFMLTVFGGILSLFTLLAVLFRIDRDTMLICLVSGLYGPPFIGPIAQKLGNREIVVSGMTLGVLGLAMGNFLGFLVYAWWGG